MNGSGDRLAAIDVGSNTVLLTVAELDPDSGLIVLQEAEDQPRLGAGLSETGRLSDDAMDRAIGSLLRMREICRHHSVRRLSAVATAAVRDAKNGAEFVDRVRALDIPLRIISAETEAVLSYRSAAHHFPAAGQRTLVADIGGRSLELIGAAKGRIELLRSLPLGAVRLTELEVPLATLRDHVRGGLDRALPRNDWAGATIIGSGGTFATLGSMVLARWGTPSGRSIHGMQISGSELQQVLTMLASMSPAQRGRFPGLRPERADIVVAGLAVAAELLERVGAPTVTVSAYGLRDGLLLELVGLE